ncbi:unnamed protein product [Protopolystoma xenopodis]|uniref:Uncharacterized protein n=1 Tax=Protopolystoma xenopodis TaxID=117903 RepID=A0A3S5CGU8_9PLAT|nr:unnamed protein product [Protopolystoma xenopodis]
MTGESSARIHWGRRAVRRGPVLTNLQPQLQGKPSPQPPVEPTYEYLSLYSSNEMKEDILVEAIDASDKFPEETKR